jgi:hypothetical protein
MVVPRSLRIAIVAASLASLIFGGSAAAAMRGATVLGVWGSMGVFGTYADFGATWDATTFVSGMGIPYWRFDDFQMNATLRNGLDCPVTICKAWSFAGSVSFLNANNTQVGSFTPPSTIAPCYEIWHTSRDRMFYRCRTVLYDISKTAVKMKLSWTVSVQRASDGLWLQAWKGSKTVTIS